MRPGQNRARRSQSHLLARSHPIISRASRRRVDGPRTNFASRPAHGHVSRSAEHARTRQNEKAQRSCSRIARLAPVSPARFRGAGAIRRSHPSERTARCSQRSENAGSRLLLAAETPLGRARTADAWQQAWTFADAARAAPTRNACSKAAALQRNSYGPACSNPLNH
jgi:hypothetical protein